MKRHLTAAGWLALASTPIGWAGFRTGEIFLVAIWAVLASLAVIAAAIGLKYGP